MKKRTGSEIEKMARDWFEGPALLECLVSEKLRAEAEAIATESQKWVEVSLDLPYGYSHGLRRLSEDTAPMTDAEGAAYAKLLAEYRALEEEYEAQDEFPEGFDARPLIFGVDKIGRAGAFVTLDRLGELAVSPGFMRPEDELREDADVHSGGQAADGQGAELSAAGNVDAISQGRVITSDGQALGVNDTKDQEVCSDSIVMNF
ncbi:MULTISPECIES: hypothetical protein [Marinovum]|nr:hypothetical protein [Marinovum algicola]